MVAKKRTKMPEDTYVPPTPAADAPKEDKSPTVEEPSVLGAGVGEAPVVEKTPMDLLHEKVQGILKHYGGESNVPFHHEYWDLQNKLRAMVRGDL